MRKLSGNFRVASALRVSLAVAAFTVASALPVAGARDNRISLTGEVSVTDVSGIAGTPVVVGEPKGTQAVYGIRSLERDGTPCYIATVTEEVNNYGKDSGFVQNLCGHNPGGAEMQAKFGDIRFSRGTFVRAVRVCMTEDGAKIKGIQLRGREFGEDGTMVDLPRRYAEPPSSASLEDLVDLNAPSDMRLHCDVWKGWVECPPGEIATAITAHFRPESQPDSLTGIALQCRELNSTR
jgi:hypothetical protein